MFVYFFVNKWFSIRKVSFWGLMLGSFFVATIVVGQNLENPPVDIVDEQDASSDLNKKISDIYQQLEAQKSEPTEEEKQSADLGLKLLNIEDLIAPDVVNYDDTAVVNNKPQAVIQDTQNIDSLQTATTENAATDQQEQPANIPQTIATNKKLVDVNIENKEDLAILDLVIAQPRIKTNSRQWVEVYLQNNLPAAKVVYVQLLVTLPNGKGMRIPLQKKNLIANAVSNIIFNFPIPKDGGGIYLLSTKVYDSKNKLLSSYVKTKEFIVEGTPMRVDELEETAANNNSNTNIEKFDVYIDRLRFLNAYALPASYVPLEISIYNNGSTKATSYSLKVYFVNSTNRFAPIGPAIYTEDNLNFAAGERKLRQITAAIPLMMQTGELFLLAQLETAANLLDNVTDLNILHSERPLLVSKIIPQYPLDNQVVATNAPTTFSWDSRDVENFYIEFSLDQNFNNNKTLQFPNGSSIKQKQITSTGLENFINYLLLQQTSTSYLFWRVVGLDNLGFIDSTSPIQKLFYENK